MRSTECHSSLICVCVASHVTRHHTRIMGFENCIAIRYAITAYAVMRCLFAVRLSVVTFVGSVETNKRMLSSKFFNNRVATPF